MSVAAGVMALIMCLFPVRETRADSVGVKPFIAFGADLTAKEKKEVVKQFGLTEEELADYDKLEVTNEDEHEYLDEYLASSVIGTRALSSVMIEEADSESGIEVETHNISFCTKEMYTNALVTAGIEDAKVTVAGPFPISGTAALVGAMKAYEIMTGDEVDKDKSDAATNELVVTGELGETIGKEKAAEFVATLKNKVLSEELSDEGDIGKALDETAKQFDVKISGELREKMISLMKKLQGLDLDLDRIKEQAKGVYDKIKDMGIDLGEAEGIFAKIADFFANIWGAIVSFFKGLFS